MLQLAHNYGHLETVLNKSLATDLETVSILLKLLKSSYLRGEYRRGARRRHGRVERDRPLARARVRAARRHGVRVGARRSGAPRARRRSRGHRRVSGGRHARGGSRAADRDGGRRVDLLVNNAGRGYYAAFRDIDARELDALFQLNVIAPLRLTQLALPSLERRRGTVVMMSSVAGVAASPKMGAYAASKFALEALAIALRAELAPAVSVVVVRPGPVETPFRENAVAHGTEAGVRPPGARAQSPDDIAEYTLRAVARRTPVVETSAFVRVVSFGARALPPVFRAALRRMR